ncbi:hypothetical protein ACHHYP_00539 [Achlya hypogyna]|uniref:Uncharacterized protein n=1 Tax=Achlya hypogyna TaxID=1202772 RepID=A0A1V9ZUE5_ACHHY|nr:hypothetical protein ACHHYP_00539 [Achlya hypogyna]
MEPDANVDAMELMRLLDLSAADKATWNMSSDGMRRFVDGLTTLAALECDPRGIKIRNVMMTRGAAYIAHVVDALKCRDVLLKCKSASALGSICMCRDSSVDLLKAHGTVVLAGLTRMVVGKNRWAQGDAIFVLGWIARWANDDVTLDAMSAVVPNACAMVASSWTTTAEDDAAEDRETNLRIYPYVFLLNLSQHRSLAPALDAVIAGIADTIEALLGDPSIAEAAVIARLSTSLMVTLVDKEPETVRPLVLAKKMLPSVAKLSRKCLDEDGVISDQCRILLELVVKTHR